MSFAEASCVPRFVESADHRVLDFAQPDGKIDYNPGARLLVAPRPGAAPVYALPIRRENADGIPVAETVIYQVDEELRPSGHAEHPGSAVPLTAPAQIMGEDPRWLFLRDGSLVLWAVEARWPATVTDETFTPKDLDRPAYFETVFYHGTSIADLREVGRAPRGNKGIVLTDIGIFYARPQLGLGHGIVSAGWFTTVEDIIEKFDQAQPIGGGVFRDGVDGSATYGGIGDAWPVPGEPDMLLLLAHDAWAPNGLSEPDREYRAVMLLHHVPSGAAFHLGVLATRDQWPAMPAKIPGREHVVYHGGMFDLTLGADGTLAGAFTVGLSDARLGWAKLRTTVALDAIISTARRQLAG
jgi:hypothetical protein